MHYIHPEGDEEREDARASGKGAAALGYLIDTEATSFIFSWLIH